MRKLFYIISALFIASCEDSLQEPVLDVSFASNINVEDGVAVVAPNQLITFNISGDMDLLYYYDGKVGSRYHFEDIREGGELSLFFGSQFETRGQHENLSLWVSADFNDDITIESFNQATWTQIPLEYTKDNYKGNINTGGPAAGGGFPSYSSPIKKRFYSPWINLFDYLPEGAEKFHIAFKYESQKPYQDEEGVWKFGTKWNVNWFDVRREYVNGAHAYYGLYSPVQAVNDHRDDLRYVGFRPLSFPREESHTDSLKWDTSRNAIIFSNPNSPADVENNPGGFYYCDTDYAISREFEVNPEPEPEYSVALKMTTGDVPTEATAIYKEPGEYTVTFIAKNYKSGDMSEVIKELKVRVVDETSGE